MRSFGLPILLTLVVASMASCSSDKRDKKECDDIAAQIRTVALQDTGLENYQGVAGNNRQSNPCAEPIAVTTTDYHKACAELSKCLAEAN